MELYFIYASDVEIFVDLEAKVSNWVYEPYDLVFYLNWGQYEYNNYNSVYLLYFSIIDGIMDLKSFIENKWKITGYWFSPDGGFFKLEGDEYVFKDGGRLPSTAILRCMPVSEEEYASKE